jgi:hypothetical protein
LEGLFGTDIVFDTVDVAVSASTMRSSAVFVGKSTLWGDPKDTQGVDRNELAVATQRW